MSDSNRGSTRGAGIRPAGVTADTATSAFCDVVIPRTRLDELTYSCDSADYPDPRPGDCVWVNLRGRKRAGVVFGQRSHSPVARTLSVLGVAERGFLPAETVALISWVSSYYWGRKGEVLTLSLPGGRLPVAASRARSRVGRAAVAGMESIGGPHASAPSGKSGFSVWVNLRPHFDAVAAAIRAMRKKGSVILLAPESRLAEWRKLMAAEWGDDVVELHGQQTARERRESWERVRRSLQLVVVGVRSAVLAPVRDLAGLVVVDEHLSDFKEERRPRFHARDVAVARGRLSGCPVVISDATPSAETWLNLKNGMYRWLGRPRQSARQVDALTVDMRRHKGELLSPALDRELRRAAAQARSVVLYLNRRGVSRSVVCRECGRALACAACGLPLLLTRKRTLECRWHGAAGTAPDECPVCAGSCFEFRAPGIDAVVEAVRRMLPESRVSEVVSGGYPEVGPGTILVGTRTLLGMRWPDDVALVAAVDADVDLALPDFRARERTFQTLTGLLMRAERLSARAVIQTRRPEDPAIVAALSAGVKEFMDAELERREEPGFPPYRRLVLIELRRTDSAAAEALARLLRRGRGVEVLGPVPGRGACFRLLVKLPRELPLVRVMPPAAVGMRGADVRVDVDPLDVV